MSSKTLLMAKVFNNFILLSPIFFLVILVQGCAVSAIPKDPIAFVNDNNENGLIVGSVTFLQPKARYNGYFLNICEDKKDSTRTKPKCFFIHFAPKQIIKMRHNGELDSGLTYLFTIEKPAGKYRVGSLRLYLNGGSVYQQNDYLSGFSIPFKVAQGKITYSGNLVFNEFRKKNEPTLLYRHTFKKDIEGMKVLQPSIDWSKAVLDTSIAMYALDKTAN